jgi:bifunctional DNase/RNase
MENLTPRKLYEKEVKLTAVYEQTTLAGTPDYFVQLKDGAGRDVKVMVDYNQAASISLAAEGKKYRRPLTHDLMAILVERMGWKLDRILIDDLYNDTFYAKLSLTKDSEIIDIDCRPSDAIALALRVHAPIFVAEDVLAAVASGDQITEEGDSLD